ncbi:MAG: exopolyphosphatase [Acidobacteriota bacterium]
MRLVTRGDLDGLTCAVIICQHEKVDEILLIHPQDITENRVAITGDDIIANLPYHSECAMWFDHHLHTATPTARPQVFKGKFGQAPSAARLVYEYYGGSEKMPRLAKLVWETDRLDSANLTPEDVTHPEGFIKIGFTIDGRTGIGSFQDYFHTLVEMLIRKTPLEQILAHPQVEERCRLLDEQAESFRQALDQHSRQDGNVIITDFRPLASPPVGNRFLVYALYPDANVSIRLQWGPQRQFQMLTLGHSIFNRTCQTNVGELAARYGGGGHKGAGSIPLMEDPDQQIQMVLGELKANG